MTWKVVFLERLEPLQKIYASPILFEEYHKSSPCVGQSIAAQASCRYRSWMHLMLRESFIHVAFWGLSLKHIFLWNLELKWIPLECRLKLYLYPQTHLECKTAVKMPVTATEFLRQCVCLSLHLLYFPSCPPSHPHPQTVKKNQKSLPKKPLGDSPSVWW